MARKPKSSPEFVVTPFVVIVDSREQAPFQFQGMKADAKDGGLPLVVRTERRGLQSGDYSIDGHESEISIERKSLEDLYSTIGQGRDRFIRELERLAEMRFAAVVIESGWGSILGRPPCFSKLRPKTVYRSILAWQQRYPTVHWLTMPSRDIAEKTTFRILERFWKDRAKEREGDFQRNGEGLESV